MTQDRSFNTFTSEQTLTLLKHFAAIWQGYAFALAQKAGLGPVETARLFVEPYLSSASFPSLATEQTLEQQARQIAGTLVLTHEEQSLHIEHQGDVWLLKAIIPDREALERYGVSLEWHTQWLAEQLRLVCEPKGITCAVWLEENAQYIRLSI